MIRRHPRHARKQVGALGALIFCALFLIIIGVGAIALDMAHVGTVRTELQSATDAAALAGAMSLHNDPDNADDHALQVAATNTADGKAVSNLIANTTITSVSDTISDPPTVEVDAQRTVNHMLAPIFGRRSDSIGVKSKSAYYPQILVLGANQALPITVSLDQWPNGNSAGQPKPLNQLHEGEDLTIVVRPSGNPGRNAAWTSFNLGSANTNTYRNLIEQVLGTRAPDASVPIPQLEAGRDSINIDNGQNVGVGIDGTYLPGLQAKPFVTVPVIKGNQFNQSRLVRGFITIKVKTASSGQGGTTTIVGTLVKGIVRGWPGEVPSSGSTSDDDVLAALSPAAVKLLTAGN